MNAILIVWCTGWGLATALMPFWLKKMAEDHRNRTESASFRSLWMSQQGRAAWILGMFVVWPIMLVCMVMLLTIYYLDRWFPRKRRDGGHREEGDPDA